MKAVILDQATLGDDISLEPLEKLCELTTYPATDSTQKDQRLLDMTACFTNKVPLGAEDFARHPKLKYIGVLATGTDHIDLNAAKQRGIIVNKVTDYCSDSIAQHWLCLTLALAQSLKGYLHRVGKGEWSKSPVFCLLDEPITSLTGKTLVIYGYGRLGKAVSDIAKRALGLRVLISERVGHKPREGRVAFEQCLQEADILSLHTQITDENRGFVNQDVLSRLKPGAFLINLARGGLIDEEALLSALDSGHLAGAALDVVAKEPPSEASPLFARERSNLLITPHMGWASKSSRELLVRKTAASFLEFLESLK